MSAILVSFALLLSCNKNDSKMANDPAPIMYEYEPLPDRPGPRPETTSGIPHHQIGVELVPEIQEEMVRRVYAVPGIEDRPSVILSWQGLSLEADLDLVNPQAVISGRELGHIHDDGSLHIFLDPARAAEAVEAGWAIDHPFAVQGDEGWDGFVMLYTPQTLEELNVIFQLIVDGFNFTTGKKLVATDYY